MTVATITPHVRAIDAPEALRNLETACAAKSDFAVFGIQHMGKSFLRIAENLCLTLDLLRESEFFQHACRVKPA